MEDSENDSLWKKNIEIVFQPVYRGLAEGAASIVNTSHLFNIRAKATKLWMLRFPKSLLQ